MSGTFGILTIEQWLAILRIGLGLWWIKSVFHKDLKDFVNGGMTNWTVALADNHPIPAFGNAIKALVSSNRSWFPYLILVGELAVGIGLTFGILTPISLAVAMFLNLQYVGLAGVKPKDRSVNPAYQCEQGQNWSMFLAELVLFFTVAAAGCTWSLDHALGLFCG
jgi:thiosulfate dehydrogenase [quinone] large subunit